ncbi:MAG TPA: 3-mercaptopyruvate sulfurtransferase [Caulobacteraceae bacterium]
MSDPLVTTEWLAAQLDEPTIRVLDATWFMPDAGRDAKAEFTERHIPGAAFFDIDEISDHARGLPHMASAPADFAIAARRLGVSRDSQVIVYDAHGLLSAARAWWNFRAMGHEASFVLDGGLPKWLAEGRPVETGWARPAHGDFKARPDPALVSDLQAVREALASGEAQVVDARPASRFAGTNPEPRPGLRPGHMPGALNLPFASLVKGSGELAEPDALRAAFAAAGVDLSEPIVTTCGSGITAAVLALALARLGRPDAAVYDGSWSEWGARSDTAVAVG